MIVCPVSLINVSLFSDAPMLRKLTNSCRIGRMSFTNGETFRSTSSGILRLAGRLGRDRLGIFTGDKDKNVITQFVNS